MSEKKKLTPEEIAALKKEKTPEELEAIKKAREEKKKAAEAKKLAAKEKAANAKIAAATGAKPAKKQDEDELDPKAYFENRTKQLQELETQGFNAWPHKFHVTIEIGEFLSKYEGLQKGETMDDVIVSVAGRVISKRASGSNLIFMDLVGKGQKVQIMANAKAYEQPEGFKKLREVIKRGDIVGVRGYPTRTRRASCPSCRRR